MNTGNTFYTLNDLDAQRAEIRSQVDKKGEQVGALWSTLIQHKPASTKGELATNIIANSITAIDTFLLVRRLMAKYGHIFHRKKKRR